MKTIKRGFFLLIFVVASFIPPHSASAKAPVLLAGKARLGLRALDVKVEVVEDIARTTLEMTFFNNEDRQLEGTLYFPLPPGATVSSFGMYFGNVLRPGVVVEKERGRVIYESIKRRQIDPALVELESGNKFKTRVFPIPPKGEKRIQVAYEEDLVAREDGLTYVLPLDYGLTVKNFRLKLTIKGGVAREVTASGLTSQELILQKRENGKRWEGAINEEETDLNDVLRLSITPSEEQSLSVWTERQKDGVSYFRVTYRPGLATAPRTPAPNVLILWDTSLSGQKRDQEKDLAFLKALLNSRAGSARYRMATFNLTVSEIPSGFAPLTKEAIPGIPSNLRESVYDGATDLGTLLKAVTDLLADEGKTDVVIFSDLLNSYGDEIPREAIKAATKAGAVFFPIISTSATNPAFISALVADSGGVAIDLLSLTNPKEAVSVMRVVPPYLTEIIAPTRVDEIYPKTAQDASASIVFTGRYTKGGQVTFQLNFSEQGRKVTREVAVELPSEPEEGDLLRRVWAKSKIAELLADPARYAKEIVSLGKAYSVVTPYTSLIVLDSYEDYTRYGLTPPPDVVKEWESRRRAVVTESRGERARRPRFSTAPWPSGSGPVPSHPLPPHMAPSVSAPSVQESRPMMDVGPGGAGGFFAHGGPSVPITPPVRPPTGPVVEVKVEPAYYKKILKEAIKESPEAAYKTYLKIRKQSREQIPFYLFTADLFHEANQTQRAELILSNIVEIHPDTAAYVRVFAHRLKQWGGAAKAVPFFKRVVRLRSEEPQSYRDLGMGLAALGKYREALTQLQIVLEKKWDGRFKDIHAVVGQDVGWIAEKFLGRLPKDSEEYLEISRKYLEGYRRPELRIVMTWDADNTDIDLWVTEPSGEKCFYKNRKTSSGGRMSDDLTMGYGPEAYTILKAPPGSYKIQVHYYSSDRTIQLEGTSVQVTIIKYPGTDREDLTEHTVYLKKTNQVVEIETVKTGS